MRAIHRFICGSATTADVLLALVCGAIIGAVLALNI